MRVTLLHFLTVKNSLYLQSIRVYVHFSNESKQYYIFMILTIVQYMTRTFFVCKL